VSVNRTSNPIFEEEQEIVAQNRRRLEVRQQDGELASAYARLLADYERLLRTLKKIAAISDVQGKMLKQRENDLRSLLDHAGQGFLTVGRELAVGKLYSRECGRLFGGRIGGASIASLLWKDALPEEAGRGEALLRRMLDAADAGAAESAAAELPGLFRLDGKDIGAVYKRIPAEDADGEPLVLIILTDLTEQLATREKASYLSTHDPLTSLYNRGYVEPILEAPPSAADLPYSLIVIDMNGLKLANDVFGHRAGDRLLMRAAALLQAHAGEASVSARWGGDEFVILLPRTDEPACAALAARLKAACEEADADPVKLSMAIGCATLRSAEDGLYPVFAAAEKAMYKTKLLENRQVRVELMQGVTDALLHMGYEDPDRLKALLELTCRFAAAQGISSESRDMKLLRSLVLLHDAGNLALPAHILQKPGPLDAEEWEIVKSHSEIGYRMAQSIGEWALAEAILGMHEHWDGSGYPYGLSGEQIPFLSRLFAIVDAYDTMTHDRVYKPRLDADEAIRIIMSEAGRQFDPGLAEAFVCWMIA